AIAIAPTRSPPIMPIAIPTRTGVWIGYGWVSASMNSGDTNPTKAPNPAPRTVPMTPPARISRNSRNALIRPTLCVESRVFQPVESPRRPSAPVRRARMDASLFLSPWLAPRGRATGSQPVEVLPDLFPGQARAAFLAPQRLEHLLLLLRRQPREMFLDVLAVEVLHRVRHHKLLPLKLLEELLQQPAGLFRAPPVGTTAEGHQLGRGAEQVQR